MANVRRLDAVALLGSTVLLLVGATSPAPRRAAIVDEVARTYGIDSFGEVEAIRYTFNAGGGRMRVWEWEPKTGKVSYEGKGKDGKPVTVTYIRSQINNAPEAVKDEVDPAFINDNYWLLFPLHAYWDSGAQVQDLGMEKLPLGPGSARRVVVKYPEEGGYTPGDTWELYVGSDDRVEQMVYHRGGTRTPRLVIAKWEGYEKAGPLLVSTEHSGSAGGHPFRIWFSDVSVKLTGSNTWIKAHDDRR